jgi:hypothetical protein
MRTPKAGIAMKSGHLLLLFLASCTGCTTLALERHTLSQGASPTEIRYQEVMDNLALVARDPFALPAYSSIFAGTAQITDTSQILSSTIIGPAAAAQLVNPQFTRAILGNWTLDPINTPEKLEAMRCVCRWVLFGPDFACQDCAGLLEDPPDLVAQGREITHDSGRHFGVADRMRKLPVGWLHRGKRCDVPASGQRYPDFYAVERTFLCPSLSRTSE